MIGLNPSEGDGRAAGERSGGRIRLLCLALLVSLASSCGESEERTSNSKSSEPASTPARNRAGCDGAPPVRAAARFPSSLPTAPQSTRSVPGPIGVGVVSSVVEISGEPARLEVESVTGSVAFRGATRALRATTMSGAVEARGVSGTVRLETVSGSIVVEGSQVSSGELRTISGDITFAVTSADLHYDAMAMPNHTANIADNDASVIVLTESGGSTDIVERGFERGLK